LAEVVEEGEIQEVHSNRMAVGVDEVEKEEEQEQEEGIVAVDMAGNMAAATAMVVGITAWAVGEEVATAVGSPSSSSSSSSTSSSSHRTVFTHLTNPTPALVAQAVVVAAARVGAVVVVVPAPAVPVRMGSAAVGAVVVAGTLFRMATATAIAGGDRGLR
jgi:hypothetical protein